jgi:WD40 repeat protein
MSPGLGFFTEYVAAGTFALTGAERAHFPDWFWKGDLSSLLTIEATGAEYSDVTHVRFMEDAQAGFAGDGDFHKLFSTTEGLPQIYTLAGADQLAVNALPSTEVVPMGFTASTSGTYTLKAIETSEFSQVELWDLFTGEVTDLLTGSYSFSYAVGDDANRFELHFAPVGTPEFNANSVKIWSSDNNIYVNVPKTLEGTISVFNMMGQEVVSTDTQIGVNVIPMNEVNTYYVVKVLSNDNAITGKVYIK